MLWIYVITTHSHAQGSLMSSSTTKVFLLLSLNNLLYVSLMCAKAAMTVTCAWGGKGLPRNCCVYAIAWWPGGLQSIKSESCMRTIVGNEHGGHARRFSRTGSELMKWTLHVILSMCKPKACCSSVILDMFLVEG